MSTPNLAVLSDSPNARRYTPSDKEAAYQLWRQTSGRSLRQTAAILGISPDTVDRWHEQQGWDQRLQEEETGAGKSSAEVARSMVAPLFVKAIVMASRILDDPAVLEKNPNAVVKTMELVAGWNGLVVPKAPQLNVTKTLGDGTVVTVKASDLSHLTPDQLAHYARTGELPATASPDPALPDTD